MRSIAILLALIVMLFSNSEIVRAENNPGVQGIQWLNYSNAAFDKAKATNQYILLYGKSDSCHWCQEMSKTTWRSPAVIAEVNKSFIPVVLDIDTEQNIAIRYRITSLPTVMILDSNNRVLKIFSGYFTPEFMEKNLKEIKKNDVNPIKTNQPEIIKESEPAVSTTLLPAVLHDELKKKQLSIFGEAAKKSPDLDIDAIEYALILSAENENLTHDWIVSIVNSGKMYADKSTMGLAKAIQIYYQIYAYWPDPKYISSVGKLVTYINKFLSNSDGVFYAGIFPSNKRIFTDVNGSVITSFVDYYMMTGDSIVLAKAVKATRWVIDNLSIPDGGFRHEKTENNIIYLNDTLAMGNAYLALYKATTNPEFLNRAVDAAKFINKYFQNDGKNYGFVSTLDLSDSKYEHIEIKARENAEIVRFTSLVFSYVGDKFLQQMQNRAFQYLMMPEVLQNTSPAIVLLAEYWIAKHPIHIAIVGSKNDPEAKDLHITALRFSPLHTRIDWWDRAEGPLMNSDVIYPVLDKSAAYVCHGFQCSFPIYNPQVLSEMIHNIIIPASVATPPRTSVIDNGTQSNAENLLTKSNLFFVIVGFIGFGLLLSFTPCILPLIPIMVSIIVGHTIGVQREKTFLLCLIYVLAMSVAYALLGLLAGICGVYLQAYMQAKWVIISFSLIFLMLGLSMLGAYELRLPTFLQTKISKWSNLQKGGTYFGVIMMGFLSTFVISPCVSAPLAGVLSFVAKTSDYMLGAVGLFFMSIGMGLPLLIICLFSKNILPKAARWNNQIKTFFGLVMLGISIWMVSRVIPNAYTMMLSSALIILITIYMGLLKRKAKSLFAKFWKTLTIMTFIYGVALFSAALFMSSDLYALFVNNRVAPTPHHFVNVKNKLDLEQDISQAKEQHMPIILDFSAEWCSACVAMDKTILGDQTIMHLLNKFILLRVDLTKVTDENTALAKQFNIVGPPAIIFFDANGNLNNLRATGELTVDQLNQLLERVLVEPLH